MTKHAAEDLTPAEITKLREHANPEKKDVISLSEIAALARHHNVSMSEMGTKLTKMGYDIEPSKHGKWGVSTEPAKKRVGNLDEDTIDDQLTVLGRSKK